MTLRVPIEIREKITRSKCVICRAKGGGCDAQLRFSRIGMWLSFHSVCAQKVGWAEKKARSPADEEAPSPTSNGLTNIASAFLGVVLGETVLGSPAKQAIAKGFQQLAEGKKAAKGEETRQEERVVDAEFEVLREEK